MILEPVALVIRANGHPGPVLASVLSAKDTARVILASTRSGKRREPTLYTHNGHVWIRRADTDRHNPGVHKPAIELNPGLAAVGASVQAVLHIWAKGGPGGAQSSSHNDVWAVGGKINVSDPRITPLFGVRPARSRVQVLPPSRLNMKPLRSVPRRKVSGSDE